ncbi:MAG: hypothetical protein AAFQ82_07795, partial [Myxococcota bacterium]
ATIPARVAYAVNDTGVITYVNETGELFEYVDGGSDIRLNDSQSGRGDGFDVSGASIDDSSSASTGTGAMGARGETVWIADYGFGAIRKIEDDRVTTAIGRVNIGDGGFPYAFLNEPESLARLSDNEWLAVDQTRVCYIANERSQTVLGYPGGPAVGASPLPSSFAEGLVQGGGVASNDNTFFVADSGRGRILQVTLDDPNDPSRWSVEEWATDLGTPTALAVGGDSDGVLSLFVSDENAHTITQFVLSTKTPTVIAGGVLGFADGDGTNARFNRPRGLALAESGVLFVADSGNNAIRRIECTDACAVTTVLGSSSPGRLVGGAPASSLSAENPSAVFLDRFNNLLVVSARSAAFVNPGIDGIIDASDRVFQIFESSRSLRAECLSAGAVAGDDENTVVLLDRCQGAWIELTRSAP